MRFIEETALISCAGEILIGILAKPDLPAQSGVVVIVGGPQYRVGSHRQFVLLSRALAHAGYAVLRFDYRGMGDSSGVQRDFESASDDIGAAIAHLQQGVPAVKEVALWGLCDGASAALLYCYETHDPRVTGLCLLNPWVRSVASLAKTQVKHYYAQRLRQKEFWVKLLSGKVALSALGSFVRQVRQSAGASKQLAAASQPFQQRMALAWHGFSGRMLLILSGNDYTAKEFVEYAQSDAMWRNYMGHAKLQRQDIAGVDHTFSDAASRKLAEEATLNWLRNNSQPAAAS